MLDYRVQLEISAFTSALTSICNGRVKVVFDGTACTDGETIHLPRPVQVISKDQVLAILGVACHEAAHVFYETPKRHRAFIEEFDDSLRPLAADCYNAVVDVADETRFEQRFPLARKYFASSTTEAATRRSGITGHLPLRTTDDVLVAAILGARIGRVHDDSGRRGILLAARNELVSKCVLIVANAITQKGEGTSSRSMKCWSRLSGLAQRLLEELARSGMKVPKRPQQADRQCILTVEGTGGALADVFRDVFTEATDGAVTLRSNRGGESESPRYYAGDTRLKRSFRQYARLLLQGPQFSPSFPSTRGPKLGDVTRLRIDGRVLLRRGVQPNIGTAVAICLDCSDSMRPGLVAAASTAAGMAEALDEAGGNVACWHYGRSCKRVPVRSMHRAHTMGSTRTDLAIQHATKWLMGEPELQKVVVILTDGEPDSAKSCAARIQECHKHRISVLAGTIGRCSRNEVLESMPGASLFEIGTNFACGFHQAIRRIVTNRRQL